MTRPASLLLALAVFLPWLASLVDAVAGQPRLAEAWTERLSSTRAVVLNVRVAQPDPSTVLWLRLRGEALNPGRLPHDVNLSPFGAAASRDVASLGDARLCPVAGDARDCRGTAVAVTIFTVGVSDGAEIQGSVTAIGGVSVAPANRGVFVAWVRGAPPAAAGR